MDEPLDTALIAQARHGGAQGKKAWRQLIARHQGWLVRYLVYLLGNMVDADDVAQEVLVKAFLSLHSFRGDASFRTWVRAIATRRAFNHRREARTRTRYHDKLESSRFAPSPASAIEAREALVKVLDQLPYPYREILVLRHVEELSMEQTAHALGIGVSAAKMRASRARGEFLKRYKGDTGHGD